MRTPAGSGASTISAVSDWNSRTTLSGAALLRGVRSERNDFMRCRPGLKMTVLQVPQPGIDVAAFEQLLVRPGVVEAAAFEHDDLIGRHQRGQAVRDDDQGPTL